MTNTHPEIHIADRAKDGTGVRVYHGQAVGAADAAMMIKVSSEETGGAWELLVGTSAPAKKRGCRAGAQRDAARFGWWGHMKRLGLVAAIAAPLAALTGGCGGTRTATATLPALTPARQQLNYLWTIPSVSGSLSGPNDQHLTLRLVGVRDYMTRFTDRPVRQAYVVANADFVRRFRHYFADSNPNAVLSYSLAGKAIPIAIVLQLGKPDWDPKTSTLTFSAKRIPRREDDLPDTTVHIKPPFIPNPPHFDNAGLFIDSAARQSISPL